MDAQQWLYASQMQQMDRPSVLQPTDYMAHLAQEHLNQQAAQEVSQTVAQQPQLAAQLAANMGQSSSAVSEMSFNTDFFANPFATTQGFVHRPSVVQHSSHQAQLDAFNLTNASFFPFPNYLLPGTELDSRLGNHLLDDSHLKHDAKAQEAAITHTSNPLSALRQEEILLNQFTNPFLYNTGNSNTLESLLKESKKIEAADALLYERSERQEPPQVPKLSFDCQVCQTSPANGLHFGARTCAACAAFFRRTISDDKKYVCKRSQRCNNTQKDSTGYRKICRACRLKRCMDIGMLPENVQHKRTRIDSPSRYEDGLMIRTEDVIRDTASQQASTSALAAVLNSVNQDTPLLNRYDSSLPVGQPFNGVLPFYASQLTFNPSELTPETCANPM